MPEEFLPKPQTDLPLPEKELPSNATDPVVKNENPEHHGNHSASKLLMLGVIGALIIAGLIGAYFFSKSASNSSNIASNTPIPTNPSKSFKLEDFPYLRDNEIYIGNKQITNTNGTVYKFVYSEDTNTLAYIKGISKRSSPDAEPYLDPESVYVQKVDGSPKLIQTLTPSPEPNSDYRYRITDIAFTPDGRQLMVTTNQELSLWDFDPEPELISEFSLPKQEGPGGRGQIFYYGDPRLSPDGSKVLLTKGYYEGASNSIVDLSTKKVTGLDNSSYVLGEYYVDWLPGNKLLSFEYGDMTTGTPSSSFNIYSSSNNKEKSYKFNKNVNDSILIGNNLYSVVTNSTDYSSGEKYLVAFNTDNGAIKTVATLPNLPDYYVSDMRYSSALNSIFINISSGIPNQVMNKIYVVNLNNSNPQLELFKDNAGLTSR
jgi:hypothetical protein